MMMGDVFRGAGSGRGARRSLLLFVVCVLVLAE